MNSTLTVDWTYKVVLFIKKFFLCYRGDHCLFIFKVLKKSKTFNSYIETISIL